MANENSQEVDSKGSNKLKFKLNSNEHFELKSGIFNDVTKTVSFLEDLEFFLQVMEYVLDKRKQTMTNNNENLEELNRFIISPLKIFHLVIDKTENMPQIRDKVQELVRRYICKLHDTKLTKSFPKTYTEFVDEELIYKVFFKALTEPESAISYMNEPKKTLNMKYFDILILDNFLNESPDYLKKSIQKKIFILLKGEDLYKSIIEKLKTSIDPSIEKQYKLLNENQKKYLEPYQNFKYSISNEDLVDLYRALHEKQLNDFTALL